MSINKYLAELIGTFILVFVGSMSILASNAAGGPLLVIVPFGFGLGLLAAIFAVGDVSGGHFNPAVTLGMWLDKRTDTSDLIGYWIGQVVGAVLASVIVLWASSQEAVAGTATLPGSGSGSALLAELAMTAIFLLVILTSTVRHPKLAGIVIPLTLAAIHFAAIPVSGSSVNPARTIGPALIGNNWTDFWVYIVGPFAGAIVGWLLYRVLHTEGVTADA